MSWTADLVRPIPLLAALVLAINDHVLKRAHVLPGWLTGKLSDVAGLFVASILGVTLARAVAGWRGRSVPRDGHLALAVIVAIAGGFAAIKLSPAVNAAVEAVWGVNRLDASDLF